MRFILTAAVWIIILSAVTLVFSARQTTDDDITDSKQINTAQISFEITTTFGAEKDPFALNITDETSPFEILLDGKKVFSSSEDLKDRIPVTTREFAVTYGKHELFVKATPADSDKSQAVRVKILENGNQISDETRWFSSGQAVNASFGFHIEKEAHNDQH